MRGRKGNARALPASVFKCYGGVRKWHDQRGITMLSTKLVAISLKRLCAKHVYDYGAGSMIPKRREPFDRNIILALINSPSPLPRVTDDLTLGRTTWRWDTPLGRSFRAAIVLGARTGVRKAEISLPPSPGWTV